jgi:hypothetical protein
MKTAVVLIVGFLIGVFGNLLANQIEAWLPAVARWLVRQQAAKMGRRSLRCREEWLADLEKKVGGLAKLIYGLHAILIPLRTRIEKSRDTPGGLRVLAAELVRERAWWLTVLAGGLLLAGYPPDPSHYAADAVVISILLVCAIVLGPSLRRAFSRRYDQLNYSARVIFGGLIIPMIALFTIALYSVPPQRQAGVHVPADPRALKSPALVWSPLPTDSDLAVAGANSTITRVKARDGVLPPLQQVVSKRAPLRDSQLPGIRALASRNRPRVTQVLFVGPPAVSVFQSVDLSELTWSDLPKQPIPSQRVSRPPQSPTSLRLIQLPQ